MVYTNIHEVCEKVLDEGVEKIRPPFTLKLDPRTNIEKGNIFPDEYTMLHDVDANDFVLVNNELYSILSSFQSKYEQLEEWYDEAQDHIRQMEEDNQDMSATIDNLEAEMESLRYELDERGDER